MPTITFDYIDLTRLIGRKIPIDRLHHALPLIKCEVKSLENNIFTVEVNTDRPDMFSTEGIARTLKGYFGIEKGYPNYALKRSKIRVKAKREIGGIRPRIACGVIRNVKLTDQSIEQIMQLQEKLHDTLGRGRSKASIGVYDLDKVKAPIIYTACKPEEINFIPLEESKSMNGNEILNNTQKGRDYRRLIEGLPRYPLLTDSEGLVLSMPPIINSEDTRVTTSTRNLFIDVTGFDENLLETILCILISNFAERKWAVESVEIHYPSKTVWSGALKPRSFTLDLNYFNNVSGLNLDMKTVKVLAEKARFNVNIKGSNLKLTIPSYRYDIMHQVDLVEDIIMMYGYDRIKPEPPKTLTYGKINTKTKFTRKVRDLMVGFGFHEIANYILTSKELQTSKMEVTDLDPIEISNPLTSEFSVLRRWLLPGLLNFLANNTHIEYPQKIFECGDVIDLDEQAETKTKDVPRLAAAITEYKKSYETIQSIVYALLKSLNVKNWTVERKEHPSFTRGRTASIVINGEEIGFMGEINPQVLENFKIPNPTVAFEITLPHLAGQILEEKT